MMIFAGAFVVFFALDILFSSGLQTLGMMPMSFLISAVSFFIVFLLQSVNRSTAGRSSIRFNQGWMLYLGFTASVNLIWKLKFIYIQYLDLSKTDYLNVLHVIDDILLIASGLILLFTLLSKRASPAYRWHLFVSAYSFSWNLFQFIVWVKTPPLVWRYGGILDLPVLFGFLMVAVKWIRLQYRFEEAN